MWGLTDVQHIAFCIIHILCPHAFGNRVKLGLQLLPSPFYIAVLYHPPLAVCISLFIPYQTLRSLQQRAAWLFSQSTEVSLLRMA